MSFGPISLTTDFGLTDHFVGAMKGVILGIAPGARVVDITHQITPFNVGEAAFVIAQAWPSFPRGSIHVVVVDPGVGSTRRPILVEAGGHYFIGPDNGVFSMIYDAAPSMDVPLKVREITNHKLRLGIVSRTFHGRDIFAPAAAHLACSVPPSRFGQLVRDAVHAPEFKPEHLKGATWRGVILKVDRFGNLITNMHVHQFPDIKTQPVEIRIAGQRIHRLALTYSDTAAGELFAMVGSSGYIEIAMNQASAAHKLDCAAGSVLELEFV